MRLDRINRVVREAVTGVRVIRAFGNEAYEEARSGDAYRSYADNMIRLNRLFAVAIPVVWMLMGALMAVVLWAGGVLTLGGGMDVPRRGAEACTCAPVKAKNYPLTATAGRKMHPCVLLQIIRQKGQRGSVAGAHIIFLEQHHDDFLAIRQDSHIFIQNFSRI